MLCTFPGLHVKERQRVSENPCRWKGSVCAARRRAGEAQVEGMTASLCGNA